MLQTCNEYSIKKCPKLIRYPYVAKDSFPVILTDNGSEFKNPEGLELDDYRNKNTKIFYCNPMPSYQKLHVEKNNEYIIYIIPKGKSFDNRTQEYKYSKSYFKWKYAIQTSPNVIRCLTIR